MSTVLYTREWWRFGWVMPGALVELHLDGDLINPKPRPPSEALATVEQARARLRLDGDYPEADIELALCGASEAVLVYLKRETNYTEPDDPAPPNVVNAVLLLAGIFIRDPDGVEAAANWEQGYLPHAITALLYGLRDPACE